MNNIYIILWTISFTLVAIWCLIVFEENKYKRFVRLKSKKWNELTIDDLERCPPWRRFEVKIARYFESLWRDVKLWSGVNDDWKDIVIRKNGVYFLVQCKHWRDKWWVKAKHVREFQWAIDVYNKRFNLKAKWIFITSWVASKKAVSTAEFLWIKLRTKNNWEENIKWFEK